MEHLSAKLMSDSSIYLTWNYSENTPVSGCLRPHCNGTKKFKVKLVMYNSLLNMKKKGAYRYRGDNHTEGFSGEGQTSMIITNSAISPEKYYKVIVKSMKVAKAKKMYGSRGYGKMWKKEMKMKCYFGKQG